MRTMRTTTERFWAKVDKSGDCWLWIGANSAGYGRFNVPGRVSPYGAHRLSYEMAYGPIPPGLDVCHTCDNPPCVNPAHLVVGTRRFNMQDAARKGRINREPRYGSANNVAKLNEAQVTEIRRIYAAGEMGQVALGARFGVSHTAIGYLLRAETWRTVSTERLYPATTTYRSTCKRGHPMRQTRLRRVCDVCGKARRLRYEARLHEGTVKGMAKTPALEPSLESKTSR
jgi:hypothetical protein